MMMGFALAAVGLDSITGQLRLTFGITELLNGFDFLIAVIGLFGFLNRWNDSMATDLEDTPAAFASSTIGRVGWEPGKHAGRA